MLAFLVTTETDKGGVQHGGTEEVDGKLNLPEIDGVALGNRNGVCGRHRGVTQRSSVDELD